MTKQSGNNILVIFDLVSTLTDAGPRYVRAFEDVCNDNAFPAPPEKDIIAMLGNKSLSEITDIFVGPLTPEKKKAFMDSCNSTCDAILYREGWHEALYPHVRETVENLHARGITLGVFTGTREDAMENQLTHHGLSALFDPLYRQGKDNVRDGAKTSEALKAEQLGAIVAQYKKDTGREDVCVVVVGDSSADAIAAKSLGLFFIGYASTDIKKAHLAQAGVTTIMHDFKELPKLVDSFYPAHNPVLRRPPSLF